MSADVIRLWEGAHADRIRIPDNTDPRFEAQVIILPCVRRARPEPDTPPRKPRTNTKGKP
jgi:hypothetical protein